MVTQNDIERLDFADIEEYFQAIVDNKASGDKVDAKFMVRKLSGPQKREFLAWFDASYHYEALDADAMREHYSEYKWYTEIIIG